MTTTIEKKQTKAERGVNTGEPREWRLDKGTIFSAEHEKGVARAFFPLIQSAPLSHQRDLHLLPPLDLPTRMLLGRRRCSSDLGGIVDNSITMQDKQQNQTKSFTF